MIGPEIAWLARSSAQEAIPDEEAINWKDPAVRDQVVDIINYWLDHRYNIHASPRDESVKPFEDDGRR